VHVARSDCSALSIEDVLAVLRVELPGPRPFLPALLAPSASHPSNTGSDEAGAPHVPDRAPYELTIECPATPVVIIVLRAPAESGEGPSVRAAAPAGRARARAFRADLTGVPESVRARVVALAIAEVVRDLEYERAAEASVTVPPSDLAAASSHQLGAGTALPEQGPVGAAADSSHPEPLAPRGAERPSHGSARRLRAGAILEAASFRFDSWLAGGGGRVEFAPEDGDGRRAGAFAGIDAVIVAGDRPLAHGTGHAVLGYAAVHAGWAVPVGRVQVSVGAGYAAGVATVASHAADAHYASGTVTGPWTAPYALGQIAFDVSSSLRLALGVRAGWVTSKVVGEDATAGGTNFALDGAWTSAQLGAAFAF
jgi:hypothetical protein